MRGNFSGEAIPRFPETGQSEDVRGHRGRGQDRFSGRSLVHRKGA